MVEGRDFDQINQLAMSAAKLIRTAID